MRAKNYCNGYGFIIILLFTWQNIAGNEEIHWFWVQNNTTQHSPIHYNKVQYNQIDSRTNQETLLVSNSTEESWFSFNGNVPNVGLKCESPNALMFVSNSQMFFMPNLNTTHSAAAALFYFIFPLFFLYC